MDKSANDTSQNDLTSTMGSVLSNTTEDKQEDNTTVNSSTSDAIPSSSSDANIVQIRNDTGLDDPISSTSDSIFDSFKRVSDTESKTTTIDSDVDMFANDFNISDVPSEKITEDVEDIVNELENLLEEGSSLLEKSSSSRYLTTTNKNNEERSDSCKNQSETAKDEKEVQENADNNSSKLNKNDIEEEVAAESNLQHDLETIEKSSESIEKIESPVVNVITESIETLDAIVDDSKKRKDETEVVSDKLQESVEEEVQEQVILGPITTDLQEDERDTVHTVEVVENVLVDAHSTAEEIDNEIGIANETTQETVAVLQENDITESFTAVVVTKNEEHSQKEEDSKITTEMEDSNFKEEEILINTDTEQVSEDVKFSKDAAEKEIQSATTSDTHIIKTIEEQNAEEVIEECTSNITGPKEEDEEPIATVHTEPALALSKVDLIEESIKDLAVDQIKTDEDKATILENILTGSIESTDLDTNVEIPETINKPIELIITDKIEELPIEMEIKSRSSENENLTNQEIPSVEVSQAKEPVSLTENTIKCESEIETNVDELDNDLISIATPTETEIKQHFPADSSVRVNDTRETTTLHDPTIADTSASVDICVNEMEPDKLEDTNELTDTSSVCIVTVAESTNVTKPKQTLVSECTPENSEIIETEVTESTMSETVLLLNECDITEADKIESTNVDNLDNIVEDNSTLMDLEAAATVAAINAEQANIREELLSDEINASTNCPEVLELPPVIETSTLIDDNEHIPAFNDENTQDITENSVAEGKEFVELQEGSNSIKSDEAANQNDIVETTTSPKDYTQTMENVISSNEENSNKIEDVSVNIAAMEQHTEELTTEASVKQTVSIKEDLIKEVATTKVPIEIIQSANVDSNLIESAACSSIDTIVVEQSSNSQDCKILPAETSSSDPSNESSSTTSQFAIIKDTYGIDSNETHISSTETKTSKLIVELSVADTTATSDCDVQSESEKETKEKRKKPHRGNFKTDSELNKVLTIEVDDIQSENYETSNDETLECSSRSDLEDGKPEYSSRISKNEDLKMTITKQKPEECHSILKIYNPDDPKDSIPKFKIKSSQQEGASTSDTVPKLSLKGLLSPDDQANLKRLHKLNSPKSSDSGNAKLVMVFSPNSQRTNRKSEVISPIKLTIKPVKQEENQQRSSPKITIKPITKPESDEVPASKGSPKITIKPLIKPDEVEIQKLPKSKLRCDDEPESIKINPKITIKPIPKPDQDEDDCPKFTIKPILKPDIEDVEVQRISPKVIIKPVVKTDDELSSPKYASKSFTNYEPSQCSPKIIIKPIPKPDDEEDSSRNSPKITIKPITRSDDDVNYEMSQCSPKITIKPIVRGDDEEIEESRNSPKITIKPIIKPDEDIDCVYSPKITIKPVLKLDEDGGAESSRASPKLIIKQIGRNDDIPHDTRQHSPKITIKPIPSKSEVELLNSPRITIKPIPKPDEYDYLDNIAHSPKITIKPIQKPSETADLTQSPRITIKPIVKHPEDDLDNKMKSTGEELIDFEEQIKQERIVLKIHKNTIPTPTSSRKREFVDDDDKSEKLGKIKLKFSKEGGHAEIVSAKRQLDMDTEIIDVKHMKFDDLCKKEDDDVVEIIQIIQDDKNDEVKIPQTPPTNEVIVSACKEDPLEKIPVFEITPESAAAIKKVEDMTPITSTPIAPTPRKRGRPRKVPLEVREEFKDENTPIIEESTRPKRSCRGPSVRTTLGIKPRKPRGPGRGRGGKRGMGTGRVGRPPGRPKLSATKLKLLKETVGKSDGDGDIKESKSKLSDVVMIEEETRMSADTNCSSRAQTPAKQIQVDIEESQSSVQSSATTESVKGRRAPRLEVHQEPEGSVISADQLAEYYWGGGGPFMLQEQVAQFLTIKSFKRKYPGIKRRPVEMQERDFIREQGLASEAMCDLGLTAVNSSDILDIMYSDFQHKYEEYCKHQRDRQVKDFSNKQKALSLQASQEKNTLAQQAVQSAAAWNSKFNKTRREERKACIDLQTFTVHYPREKIKQVNKAKIGNYPLAIVPGQFTDYYKHYTATDLNNLPLNTICYDPLAAQHDNDDSQSDCSGSDSDTSSTDSYSSSSDSSDEDCNMCTPPMTPKNILAH